MTLLESDVELSVLDIYRQFKFEDLNLKREEGNQEKVIYINIALYRVDQLIPGGAGCMVFFSQDNIFSILFFQCGETIFFLQ